MDDEIILNTDDRAARYVTNIEGWVSRNGRFYGKDERLARWAGATHVACEDCGHPTIKDWVRCESCRDERAHKRYLEMKAAPWQKGLMLYSDAHDCWFEGPDELQKYIEDESEPGMPLTIESLRVKIGKPVFAREIEPEEYYCDDLAEDSGPPPEIEEAFRELNERIRACKTPLSWQVSRFRYDPNAEPAK